MIWFGSSAGVALTNLYPEARSVGRWVRHGWFVIVAYVVALFCHALGLALASRRAASESDASSRFLALG